MKKLFIILLTLILTVSTYTNVNAENAKFEKENTQEENVYILKEGLKNRENSITVFCETTENDHMLVVDNIINEALKHTGKSDEGDYIRFHLMSDLTGKVVNKTFEKVYKLEIKFSPRYLSTYDQEQELTSKLNDFYNTLDNNMKSYDKLKAIYDYICDNVAYGYQNNSAYSALINGSSSCRGYALLFYRMALDLGFDARIIPGRVVGGNYDNYHEWNIVKVGSKWYNVDVNFGDNTGSQMGDQAKYTYFLKGINGIFKDGYGSYVPAHVRDDSYDTEEFNTNYPMSETDFNKNNFVEEPEQEEKPEENTTETTEESTEDNNQKPDEDRLSKLNELLNKITIKIKPVKVKLIKFFKVK